jgi:ABC-type Na+ transport system ATPase subunit NatA
MSIISAKMLTKVYAGKTSILCMLAARLPIDSSEAAVAGVDVRPGSDK